MKLKCRLVLIGLAAGLGVCFSGCKTPPPDVSKRQDQNLSSMDQTQAGYDTFGRKWGNETAAAPAKTAPAPAAASAAASTQGRSATAKTAAASEPASRIACNDTTWGLIIMKKTMPAEVLLSKEFMTELHLSAQACAANVVVHETVPTNASYVRSEPAATADGRNLTWQIGNLDAEESRNIKLWLKAEKEGAIVDCASVSADPRACALTRVVHPAIQLTTTAPAEAVICDPIPMTLTVTNSGSSALTGVKITDPLPTGLMNDGKSSLSFDIGNLAAGDSRELKFNATASKTGSYVNKAQVVSAQGVQAEASSTTVVREPVLTVACNSPDQRYMGRPFDVTFTVTSKGDTASAGTVLEVPVPAGLTFKSASNGGQLNGNKISWNLGSMAPAAAQNLTASFASSSAGNFQFNPTAKGICAKPVASTCQTRVVGVAAILLEKADDPDPVGEGETTTYTVKITNQGTADDSNVKLVVTIAAELAPISATSNGSISGQTVTFPTVPRLAAKESVTFRIVAKGVKVGDGRTRFELTSDLLNKALNAEESTHVY